MGAEKMKVYHFGAVIVCFFGRTSCAEKYFTETGLQTPVGLHVILTLYSGSI